MPASRGRGGGHGAGPGQQLRHGGGVRGQTLLLSDNLPFRKDVRAPLPSDNYKQAENMVKLGLIIVIVHPPPNRSMILQAESKKEYEEVSVKQEAA